MCCLYTLEQQISVCHARTSHIRQLMQRKRAGYICSRGKVMFSSLEAQFKCLPVTVGLLDEIETYLLFKYTYTLKQTLKYMLQKTSECIVLSMKVGPVVHSHFLEEPKPEKPMKATISGSTSPSSSSLSFRFRSFLRSLRYSFSFSSWNISATSQFYVWKTY